MNALCSHDKNWRATVYNNSGNRSRRCYRLISASTKRGYWKLWYETRWLYSKTNKNKIFFFQLYLDLDRRVSNWPNLHLQNLFVYTVTGGSSYAWLQLCLPVPCEAVCERKSASRCHCLYSTLGPNKNALKYVWLNYGILWDWTKELSVVQTYSKSAGRLFFRYCSTIRLEIRYNHENTRAI